MGIVVQKQTGTLSSLISGNQWYEVVNTSQVFPVNIGGSGVGYLNVETERFIDFTPSKAGNLQGVILALRFIGNDTTDDATYTIKLQEYTTSWVDRLTKTIDVSDLVPTGHMRFLAGLADFRFSSTYPITAAGGTWRFAISGTVGTPNPEIYFSENGSDEDHLFHIPYLSSTQTLGATDAVVVTDKITIDQNWAVGNFDSQSGSQSGLTSRTRYWSIYGCIPSVVDATDPKIYVPSTISANIDLEFKGSMLLSSHQTGLLIGEDEANPIPANRSVDVFWSGTGVSTKQGGLMTSELRNHAGANVGLFGTPPNNLYANLSEAATAGTAIIKVAGDVTGEWSIGNHVTIAGGESGGVTNRDFAKSEYKEIQSLAFAAGVTTITLTSNLVYDHVYLADIGTPVALHERNVTLRGVWTETYADTLHHLLIGGFVQSVGVAWDNVRHIHVEDVNFTAYTQEELDDIEVFWRGCHFHNCYNGPWVENCHASLTEVSDCSDSDTRVHATSYTLATTAYFEEVFGDCRFLRNLSVGRKINGVSVNGSRSLLIDGNYFSAYRSIRLALNTTGVVVTSNIHHKSRIGLFLTGCVGVYCGQNKYRDIYYLSASPTGDAGCFYFDSGTVNLGIVSEDDDFEDVGNIVYVGANGAFGELIIDNAKIGTITGTEVNESYREYWMPGTKFAFVNHDETAGQTKTTEQDGYLESTGTGLSDTTAYTTGAGKLAWRMHPAWTDAPYELDFKVPVDVADEPVTVQIRCKLKSTSYASGVHTPPRITVAGLGTTPVSASAAVDTTDWQLLSVTALPTRRGIMTATLHIKSDETGDDGGSPPIPLSAVYWDDAYLAYRGTMNLGGLDLQDDGGFPEYPITQLMVAGQVWGEKLIDNQDPGSFGAFFQDQLDGKMSEVLASLLVARGIGGLENAKIDNIVPHASGGGPGEARIRIWDSAANVGEEVTGLLHTFTQSADYDVDGVLTWYQLKREP